MMLKKVQAQKIEYKRPEDIAKMREAGKIVAAALRLAREMAKPGVRTLDIDQAVEEFYRQQGVEPLFKGHPGRVPFPACCCITVNEQVVHGIPGPRVLREGDLLKVDTACKKDGWCADAAISVIVGQGSPAIQRLVQVAEETLELAIREMGRRRWWSEVAALMEKYVKDHGYSVVEKYVGHGIGRTMHEPPQVPNYTNWELRRSDWRLEPGIVVAVEPMVNMGHKEVVTLPDKWTIVTRDRLPSAHVEHTVAITDRGIEVLTRD